MGGFLFIRQINRRYNREKRLTNQPAKLELVHIASLFKSRYLLNTDHRHFAVAVIRNVIAIELAQLI